MFASNEILINIQWRTEGFWRPGRRWELAPPPRRVRLARVEGALPHYLGVWVGALAANAFESIWV